MTTSPGTEALPTRYCNVCGRPEDAHPYRHAFVAAGSPNQGLTQVDEKDDSQSSPASVNPVSQGSVRIAPAGDPVLRMILLEKGIIEVADIDRIETMLKATGLAFHDPKTLD